MPVRSRSRPPNYFCESRMLHPAFRVMRPEELVFILVSSARRRTREPPVVDSIAKLRERDLTLAAVLHSGEQGTR